MWFLQILLTHLRTVYKFWSDQEVLYDYNADHVGIGNCSFLVFFEQVFVILHIFIRYGGISGLLPSSP